MSDRTPDHQTGADAPPTTSTGPALTYVRWRADAPRRGRTGEKLGDQHPAADHKCPLCPDPLGGNEPWQIMAIGPDDPDNRAKHDALRWYSAAATIAHQVCMGRVTDAVLDQVADLLLHGRAVTTDG